MKGALIGRNHQMMTAVYRAPADYPAGKRGDVLTV
ncbi:MAG: hypothetical protein RIQ83_96 [Pseudomonadota bacterium]|jgi:hypothetical protein